MLLVVLQILHGIIEGYAKPFFCPISVLNVLVWNKIPGFAEPSYNRNE